MRAGKFCTVCGAPLLARDGREAEKVFDEDLFSKSKILRLLDCVECGKVGDKYAELDGALILVDLVLLNKAAFRHVLLNGDYAKLILKMTLLAVICDGYVGWASLAGAGEFFEQEYEFYIICGKITLALAAFVAVATLTSCGRVRHFRACLLGLLMAYSARFCNLISLLWSTPNEAGFFSMWSFVYALFFLSSVRILQVSRERSVLASAATASASHAAFLALAHADWLLQPFQCE